jgi:hypothetical protein
MFSNPSSFVLFSHGCGRKLCDRGACAAARYDPLPGRKLLVDGIAVRGISMGSLGMESPNPEACEVFTFKGKHVGAVYVTHTPGIFIS